jgi:glycosyltransferase involved in cell wall biosynthesis
MDPKVTFIVPCYRLAHLLSECVNSILSQTFEDFEVLIMDDCSPDNTPEVARSFADPRVKHIRNEPNLGHLHNYNKGIGLARGEYIWLISADDRLRTPQALDRYVRTMERNPGVGFICCPAVELRDGKETGLAAYSVLSDRDTIFEGHNFLEKLAFADVVIASSGMVRRTCYEKYGVFPLDLPYAGDWYLWCLFALHYQVGYVADPMINYRGHDLSMTTHLKNTDMRILVHDMLAVVWRTKDTAESIGAHAVTKICRKAIALQYATFVAETTYLPYQMDIEEFEESLNQFARTRDEAGSIRAYFYEALGDIHLRLRNFEQAKTSYCRSLQANPLLWTALAKWLLFQMGNLGIHLRDRRRRRISSTRASLTTRIQDQTIPK